MNTFRRFIVFRVAAVVFTLTTLASTMAYSQQFSIDFYGINGIPDNLNICGAPDTLRMRFFLPPDQTGTFTDITAIADLFPGVELVAVLPDDFNFGATLVNNDDPTRPVFHIPELSPSVPLVALTLAVKANCDYIFALDSLPTVKDTWELEYLSAGAPVSETYQTTEYRDAFAVPTFVAAINNPQGIKKTGDCFERIVRITNSSLEAYVDTLIYESRYDQGLILNEIVIGTYSVPFIKIPQPNGDTIARAVIDSNAIVFALVGNTIGNENEKFEADESLFVIEKLCMGTCGEGSTSDHTFYWGCEDAYCGSISQPGFVISGDGTPNATIRSLSNNISRAGYCQPGQVVIEYSNQGIELDPGFGAMYNLEVNFGLGITQSMSMAGLVITDISLATQTMTPQANAYDLGNMPLFLTDPDGPGVGLDDIDGDGYYDDLGVDQSFLVIVDYELDCSNLNSLDNFGFNDVAVSFVGSLEFKDACNNLVREIKPQLTNLRNVNEDIENCVDPDHNIALDTFRIEHINTRGIFTFGNNCGGDDQVQIKIIKPQGVHAIQDSFYVIKNQSTSGLQMIGFEEVADTVIATFKINSPFISGEYDFMTVFDSDCSASAGASSFIYEASFICPTCDCQHIWYQDTIAGPDFHAIDPPCAEIPCPEGLKTTGFEVNRTTFGYTSPFYEQKVNPANVDTKVAISCDSVSMCVSNIVGQQPVSDSLGIKISFDHPDNIDEAGEIFSYGEGIIRFFTNNAYIDCPITPADVVYTNLGDHSEINIDIDKCLQHLGLTLMPGDSVIFKGMFAINPDGPYAAIFKKIPDFRAFGFQHIDGEKVGCDTYGETFIISKIKTLVSFPSNSTFPKGCAATKLDYRIITINNGFTDYFPNEYRQAIGIDSVHITFDPNILDAFENIYVEASIPGHPVHGNDFFFIANMEDFPQGEFSAYFDTLTQVPSLNKVRSYAFDLRISMTPSCRSDFGSSNGNNTFNFDPILGYEARYYANDIGDGSCTLPNVEATNGDISYTEPAILSIAPNSDPNVFLTTDTAVWEVKVCNVSTKSDADWTWISVDTDLGDVDIVEITDITDPDNPIVLNLKDMTNGSFAEANGLLRVLPGNDLDDVCNIFRIKGVTFNCKPKTLHINSGWQCIPEEDPNWNPADYPPCKISSTSLTINPVDASLDAQVTSQPNSFPNLCDTVEIELIIRNTGEGTLYDVRSLITIPAIGATMIMDSFEVAYPSNQPFRSVIGPPTQLSNSGGNARFAFNNFALLDPNLDQFGLPAFNASNPNDSNEFKLKYKFTLDCNYPQGQLSRFSFQGMQPCRELSNIESGETLPIFVNTNHFDNRKFSTNFEVVGGLAANGQSTFELAITNETPILSDDRDTIILLLPVDFQYIPGSIQITQPMSWPLLNPTVSMVGGQQELRFGLPDSLAETEQAILTFEASHPIINCGELEEFVITGYRRVEVYCSSTFGDCIFETNTLLDDQMTVIINGGTLDPNLAGPDISTCNGTPVQIEGTSGYTYSWTADPTLTDIDSPTPTATPTVTTAYYATITNTDGCSALDTVLVTVLSAPNASIDITSPTCNLDNAQIAITTDSMLTTTIEWADITYQGYLLENVAAGDYPFTLTSSSGCTLDSVASVPSSASTALFGIAHDAPCDSLYGYIEFNTTSAALFPVEISWTGDATGNDTFASSDILVEHLPQGTYFFDMVDANGCLAYDTIQINALTTPAVTIDVTASTCGLDNGQIEITADPINSTTIDWDNPTFQGFFLEDVAGGDYAFTVSSTDGCTLDSIVSVGTSTSISLSSVGHDAPCDSLYGYVELITSSATLFPVVVSWTGDAIGNDTFASSDILIEHLPQGTYFFDMEDANGCSATADVQINALTTPAVIIDVTATTCGLDNGQIEITADPINSTTIDWDNPAFQGFFLEDVPSGDYTFTVSSSDGCSLDSIVSVGTSTPISMSGVGYEVLCDSLYGSAELTASSTTLFPVEITWTGDASGNQAFASSDILVEHLPQGTYFFDMEDANGCSALDTVQINALTTPAVTIDVTAPTCGLDNGLIEITATPTNSTTIDWDNPAFTGFLLEDVASGDYAFTVTSIDGCTLNSIVSVGTSSAISLSSVGHEVPCDSLYGYAELTTTSTAFPVSVAWTGVVSGSETFGSNAIRINNLPTGSYDFILTDGTGCEATNSVTITEETDCIDCEDIIDSADVTVDIINGIAGVCLPIPLDSLNNYQYCINGQVYTGMIHKCDVDTTIYYSYAYIPGLVANEPMLVDWEVNGASYHDTITSLSGLVAWMNSTDPLGDWSIDSTYLFLTGTNTSAGEMLLTELKTWYMYNRMPVPREYSNGLQLFITPDTGKYVITIKDTLTGCSDSICVTVLLPTMLPLAQIGDRVFKDQNRNGIQDATEPGYADVFVEIIDSTGHLLSWQWTDSDGYYQFDVPEGLYKLKFGTPSGMFTSPQDVGVDDSIDSDIDYLGYTSWISVQAGDIITNLDAGFTATPPPGCMISAAAYDVNCNNNGTPSDPTDDVFTLNLVVQGGTGWGFHVNGMTYDTNYLDLPIMLGPYLITDGDVTFNIADFDNPSCTNILTIPAPPSCSSVIPAPITTDTIYVSTDVDVPVGFCADSSEVANIASVTVCDSTDFGTISFTSSTCFDYLPNLGYIGQDTACIIVCDDTNVCDTTIVVLSVLPINPITPTTDTIYVSTDVDVPVGFCADSSEVANIASVTVCDSTDFGTISFTSSTCFDYLPNLGYIGQDTACIIVCDDTNVCDTTIVVLSVLPINPITPTTDTIYVSTDVDVPVGFCADSSEVANIASVTVCDSTDFGTISFTSSTCFDYLPNLGYIGQDTACIIVCDDTNVCDTTIVVLSVLPINPITPTTDTIYVSTDVDVPVGFCADSSEVANIASVTVCDSTDFGTISFTSSTCFDYLPNLGYIGQDTACIIVCDDTNVCDTTIVVLSVLPDIPCTDDIVNLDSLVLQTAVCQGVQEVCLPIPFVDILQYDITSNGNFYNNGLLGCAYDTIFSQYSFSELTNADQTINVVGWIYGNVIHNTVVSNIDDLVDSMLVWDPLGNWHIEGSKIVGDYNYKHQTLTLAQFSELIEIPNDLLLRAKGSLIKVEMGYTELVFNTVDNCTDTLLVNVVCSPDLVFKYDSTMVVNTTDTICIKDLIPDSLDLLTIENICADQSGTYVQFTINSQLDVCLSMEALEIGIDSACLKILTTDNQCFILTVNIKVIPDPNPCARFISADSMAVNYCGPLDAIACLSKPISTMDTMNIYIDGILYNDPLNICSPSEAGLYLGGSGFYDIMFQHVDHPECFDSLSIEVACVSDIDTVYLTQYINSIDTFCISSNDLTQPIESISNICPSSNIDNSYVSILNDSCFSYTGVYIGIDTTCWSVCDAWGLCDTIITIINVIDSSNVLPLPIAVIDTDTTYKNVPIVLDLIDNDTINGQLVDIYLLDPPLYGDVVINADGKASYIPNTDYCSDDIPDEFTYVICNPNGCDTALVTIYILDKKLEIHNGFSPNGDGTNDTWVIKNIELYPDNKVWVFNRWGNLVFYEEGYQNTWEGNWENQILPDGVYFYHIQLKGAEIEAQTGYLMIYR